MKIQNASKIKINKKYKNSMKKLTNQHQLHLLSCLEKITVNILLNLV